MNFIEAIAAQNKDVPAVMPLDMFSYLLGKSQASPTKTITGVPPFTFKSNGDNLIDWSIKGNTGGVGERTKNIFKIVPTDQIIVETGTLTFTTDSESGLITVNGKSGSSLASVKQRFNITPELAGDYYFSGSFNQTGSQSTFDAYMYDLGYGFIKKWDGTTQSPYIYGAESQEVKLIDGHKVELTIRVFVNTSLDNLVFKPMLRAADTDAEFIPYGYEIPVTCGGSTTDIFIGDSPLGADDTITKTSTGVDIPTVNGSNTLTVDTTVQPSEMTITYHR